MGSDPQPPPILEVVVKQLAPLPALVGLCAGYEGGKWRCDQFAEHLLEWLPEWALTAKERESFSSTTAVRLLRKAVALVYTTDKYGKRGEFGELLLHAVLRQVFDTIPAINKIFYKDSGNDTVKGFDAVHVIATKDELELWLGEAKLYQSISAAIRDVISELEAHTTRDYLRHEFLLITNKIESSWPHREKLQMLLDPTTSLDAVFSRTVFPVLLTYDSSTVSSHRSRTEHYLNEIQAEIQSHHERFCNARPPPNLRIYLLLVPLEKKVDLVTSLHKRLTAGRSL